MSAMGQTWPEDLSGTADERMAQWALIEQAGTPPAQWLRRQLAAALEAWSDDETKVDLEQESRADF